MGESRFTPEQRAAIVAESKRLLAETKSIPDDLERRETVVPIESYRRAPVDEPVPAAEPALSSSAVPYVIRAMSEEMQRQLDQYNNFIHELLISLVANVKDDFAEAIERETTKLRTEIDAVRAEFIKERAIASGSVADLRKASQ